MSPVLTILTILGAVVLGLLLSRVPALGRLPATHAFGVVRMGVLAAMVGVMGFRLGRTEELINSAGTLGLAALLLAAATLAGTLLVLSVVFALRGTGSRSDVSPRSASQPVSWAALSLSGVLLTKLDGPGLGAVSFLSNMLRESMGLVLIPLLARTRFPLLAIGAGGATSMDVSLFITYRSLGEQAIPLCLVSGGILSLLVPVLVPLCYYLGS